MSISKEKKRTIISALGENGISQLGYFTKDINLYNYIDKFNIGKSIVGKEMDKAGRWMFNHRFGGGHLWWKELSKRPINQWKDVVEHLASDFFTKQGLPYVFDATLIKGNNNLLKVFSNSNCTNNWAMINGFQFVGGAFSLVISCYSATSINNGYDGDLAIAADGLFAGLNFFGGIATSNPMLIVSAIISTASLIKKSTMPYGTISGSPFDIDVQSLLSFDNQWDINVDSLLSTVQYFDLNYKGRMYLFK